MGLFDMGGADPGALYGQGLLTPEQKQAIAFRGLLGAAGAFGQAAMPSRMPVPIGAVLGAGAAGMGQAEDQAGQQALQGGLLGLQQQALRAKLGMYQAAMQPPPAMFTPGQGMPGMSPPSPGQGAVGGGLLSPGAAPQSQGLLSGASSGLSAPSGASPLDTIKKYESSGNYNTGYGGTDLSKAPLDPTGFPIWEGKDGPAGPSHAAGAYQFEPATWHKYAPMAGVSDFSPASQDAVARVAYMNEGFQPWSSNTKLMSAVGGSRPPQPTTSSGVNPDYVGWAQQQARVYTTLGMKVPDYINQAAALPMVGQTETAKKAADFTYDIAEKSAQQQLDIQKSYQQWHPPVVGRQGSTIYDQNTGQKTEVPQATTGIVAGVPTRGYMTPSGGFMPSGVQSEYTPGQKAGQSETAKNQANYGDYLSAPPSGAPASNAAPSSMVTGGAVPGAAPGASPYGVPSSLQRPPTALAPDQPDPLKFQTQPFKTSQGTLIPPLSAEFKPTAPEALKSAIPDWQKAQGEMVESLEPSLQAKQRLQTFSEMMKDVQSGSFMSHKAQWASDLRGLGLGTIANAIMSAKDAADVQTAIHENYQSTLATLKSSTNRFTQKEFQTISDNQVSPNLQPAANQRVLAENVAFLNRQIQMAQDWNTAARGGWKNPDSFETEWNRINPVPKSVDQATGEIGPLKGVNAASSQPAANAKSTEAPEGTVAHMPDGSLRIKLKGQWNTIPASSFATAPIPPR